MTFEELRTRRGQFSIPHRMVERYPSNVADLLSGMIITRCESDWCGQKFDYVAMWPYFDVVPDGHEPGQYGIWHSDDSPPFGLVREDRPTRRRSENKP